MATGKRNYWLKLSENLMFSDEIRHIIMQRRGGSVFMIYLFMCLLTINTNGVLGRRLGNVFVQFDFRYINEAMHGLSSPREYEYAVQLLSDLDMLARREDGVLYITNYEQMVGSETDWATQKRRIKTEKCTMQNAQ